MFAVFSISIQIFKSKHESYNETTVLNDIAILKLAEEVTLNEYVQISCLPEVKSFPFVTNKNDLINETTTMAIAVGWGLLNEYDDFPPMKMNNVKLIVYNESMCENVTVVEFSVSTKICAGYLIFVLKLKMISIMLMF